MQRDKIISVITLACSFSVIFIPVGIVLACFFSNWSRKKKIIICASTGVLYIVLVGFLLMMEPSNNGKSGFYLPFGNGKGNVSIEEGSKRKSKNSEFYEKEKFEENDLEKLEQLEQTEQIKKEIKKQQKKIKSRDLGRAWFAILFFLIMLLLIFWQNFRAKKKRQFENPYVDTDLYRLPFHSGSKMPMVHFLRLRLQPEEVIYFATETNKKDDEGDLVVTNKRIVIYSATENVELPLEKVEAVYSVTTSVIKIVCANEKKYFAFMHETQTKYALAVIRWACKNTSGQGTLCSRP